MSPRDINVVGSHDKRLCEDEMRACTLHGWLLELENEPVRAVEGEVMLMSRIELE